MQRYQTRAVFIIGAALLVATAFAQNYEVRTFVADPSVATTDDASTATKTFQYLYNSIRQRYVCPYCSYSQATPGNCPDPWKASGHPSNLALRDLGLLPKSRFLSLAAQEMPDRTHSDLTLPNAAGTLLYRALIGRPYKPKDSDDTEAGSKLYAAAAGLINTDAAVGPVIAENDPVRWLVIPPTPLRRDVKASDYTPGVEPDYGLPQRRPEAQADPGTDNGGDDDWRPQLIEPQSGDPGYFDAASLLNYLEIGVNPYRVDEGDTWWVRYTEVYKKPAAQLNVAADGAFARAQVSIYSVLYGWQSGADPSTPLTVDPNGPQNNETAIATPFSVIADSGAIQLTFSEGGDDADNDARDGWAGDTVTVPAGQLESSRTWVVRFMVRSNCRLIPGWQDVDDDAVDPTYKDINGTWHNNAAFDADPVGKPFGGRKEPWMKAASASTVPTVTTTDDVVESSDEPEGYTIRANCTGNGMVAVQWRDPDPATEASWTPDPTAGGSTANAIYRRTGYEWQYDAGINAGTVTNITNDEIATGSPANYSASYSYVHYAGARFMSTRTETPRTDTQWDKDSDGDGDEAAETQGLTLAYPKVIIGLCNTSGVDLVYGAYGPGSITSRRSYDVVNRWNGAAATSVCNICGAVWAPRWNGTAWESTAPTVCPYHSAAATDITELIVTNAGNTAYNGTYTRQTGMVNGYDYYRKGATSYYIYHAPAPKKRWLMATATTVTWKNAAYWNNMLAGTWNPQKEPGNPVVTATVDTSSGVLETAPQGGGAYDAALDVWRAATAIGDDERREPAQTVQHVLPASALRSTARSVASCRNTDSSAGSDPSDTDPGTNEIWAEIPRSQPPSVPAGAGHTNNYSADLGYRGGMVTFRNETAPTAEEHAHLPTVSPLTNGWDTFYRNPDLGCFQPEAGQWPYLCDAGTPADISDDHIVWNTANSCSLHGGATVNEVEGRHYFCPRCGTERRDSGRCPLDATALVQIAVASAVREDHLVAEEFDPVEVQVSVTSNAAGIAQSASAIEIGRVAPGVRAQQPDTTARGVAANNYELSDHRAFPGDVSPLPALGHRPSDAKATLRNESNVALEMRVGSVHDWVAGNGLNSHGDYLRLGQDPWLVSWGRKAQVGPLTLDTLMPRVKNPAATGTSYYEGDLLNRAFWDILAPGTEDLGGEDTWLLSGNGTRTPAAGLITAGVSAKPVPLGQPIGTYTGQHVQYLDDGDGVFEFQHWTGSGWSATDTSATEYNPSVDMPSEPLVGMLSGQVRVVETRVPQSDFYSADNDPVVLPSPTPGVMQVIWSSNRLSADSSQAGYDAAAVAAGANPTALPTSRTPLNLIYVTTTGLTDADDPLYRQYRWSALGTEMIPPARALTNQPDSAAGRIANSAPWAMWDNSGTKWAFWHRTQPNAGGVESTLRYNGVGGASTPWNLANEKFIYDTGLAKQGMRGFWTSNGAWLFWHEGTPGRERLMFRWNFDGSTTANEKPVPVTNQMGAGISDLVNAPTLPDATTPMVIRKTATSPFTYTRDASVFTNNSVVHLLFSGFVTHEGQADVCWTKFNANTMSNAGSGVTWANDNYSKLPFPRVTDEEMEPDGLHQLFGSRHLDWLVGRNAASDTPVIRAFLRGDGISPAFQLQLGYRDTVGDGAARPSQTFNIVWDDSRSNYYDRARGIYYVTPILTSVSGSSLPARCGYNPTTGSYTSGWYLRDPSSTVTSPRPISMAINPAAGTVQFSSPLFNEDAPTDRTAVFWGSDTLSGAALEDVVLHVAYTPYIYRVTRSSAADDEPSAFYDPGTAGRLTVFWRRSYPVSEAPHFGRPSYMYKCYTTSVQVGRPPVSGNATITEWTTGNAVTVLSSNPNAGIYTLDPATGQAYLRVAYNDSGGTARVERHQVIGWSQEMVVPLDTVIGDGSMVAVPESFSVPPTEGAVASVPAVRYWLFWSSPRGVYDLRLVEDNGTRVAGDLAVHPSSDIYSAVVAPDFGGLAPERTVPTISPDPT